MPIRALLVAVVVMGIAIVGGTIVLVVTVLQRTGAPSAGPVTSYTLDEPAGTRIVGMVGAQDRLALQLQGGGPDRVTVVDLKSGKTVARIAVPR